MRTPEESEGGFTLIELTIVMVMLLLVSGALFQMLDSLTRNERIQQAMVTNQERVRLAMIEVGRDVRAANPLNELSTTTDYPTMVELSLGPRDSTQTHVRWRLSGTTLVRQVLTAPRGTVTTTKNVLTNVRNAVSSQPVFEYYRPDGTLIDVTTHAGDISQCAVRVNVNIVSDVDPGPIPFSEESDFELRNLLPANLSC